MKASWIADIPKMNYGTVFSIICRKKLHNMRRPRERKQRLFVRALLRLRKQIDYNPFKHTAVITAELSLYSGLQLGERTIRRYIHKLKFNSYVSGQNPFLSRKNITARVNWARDYKKWTTMQWSTAAFSDESSLTVLAMKNRRFVWRTKHQRLAVKYLKPTFKSGRNTVNV